MRTLLLTVCSTFIFSLILVLYAWEVGYLLYQQSGGIRIHGEVTQYGNTPYAWTIPIQLPGGLIAAYANWRLGVLIMAGGLVFTAYAIASVLVALLKGNTSVFGVYNWKAVLMVLGLIWVPVPETVSWIYYFTVIY